jgi:hypothetical protein
MSLPESETSFGNPIMFAIFQQNNYDDHYSRACFIYVSKGKAVQ